MKTISPEGAKISKANRSTWEIASVKATGAEINKNKINEEQGKMNSTIENSKGQIRKSFILYLLEWNILTRVRKNEAIY